MTDDYEINSAEDGYRCIKCECATVAVLTMMYWNGQVIKKFGCMNCGAQREKVGTST